MDLQTALADGGQKLNFRLPPFSRGFPQNFSEEKEKAHKHKQILPVTARVGGGGGLPTGWPGVSRPVARGQKFMCCVRNPRNINIFVRVPGREDLGTRPGGSVTVRESVCESGEGVRLPRERG